MKGSPSPYLTVTAVRKVKVKAPAFLCFREQQVVQIEVLPPHPVPQCWGLTTANSSHETPRATAVPLGTD